MSEKTCLTEMQGTSNFDGQDSVHIFVRHTWSIMNDTSFPSTIKDNKHFSILFKGKDYANLRL